LECSVTSFLCSIYLLLANSYASRAKVAASTCLLELSAGAGYVSFYFGGMVPETKGGSSSVLFAAAVSCFSVLQSLLSELSL